MLILSFLAENAATIIIGLTLFAALSLIVASLVKKRSQGRSSCGCDCADCPASSSCHPGKERGEGRE